MKNNELREACKRLLELRDHSCFNNVKSFYPCCDEPGYKAHKPECNRLKAVDEIIGFINQYLALEGWPGEKTEEYINLERADDPSYILGEEWNEALRLCKLANLKDYNDMRKFQEKFINADQELRALKERNKVTREALEKIVKTSTLAGYAKNQVWENDLVVELMELIDGKEKE